MSRSIQIWVTSNLVIPSGREDLHMQIYRRSRSRAKGVKGEGVPIAVGGRRWDWGEVGVRCVLPAGLLYLVTAWSLMLKEEIWRC